MRLYSSSWLLAILCLVRNSKATAACMAAPLGMTFSSNTNLDVCRPCTAPQLSFLMPRYVKHPGDASAHRRGIFWSCDKKLVAQMRVKERRLYAPKDLLSTWLCNSRWLLWVVGNQFVSQFIVLSFVRGLENRRHRVIQSTESLWCGLRPLTSPISFYHLYINFNSSMW